MEYGQLYEDLQEIIDESYNGEAVSLVTKKFVTKSHKGF